MKYTEEVMEHFRNPHNMGEMKKPSATGTTGNPKCGDVMQVQIKVEKNKEGKEIIKDVKFKTFGCVSAIAASSALTDLAKGKTLEEAKKITNQDIVDKLKGLPSIKIHCSVLGAGALKKAIKDYRSKVSM